MLDAVLCCFVSLASIEPRDVSLLARQEDFMDTVVGILKAHHDSDPFARDHAMKRPLSKTEILTVM